MAKVKEVKTPAELEEEKRDRLERMLGQERGASRPVWHLDCKSLPLDNRVEGTGRHSRN